MRRLMFAAVTILCFAQPASAQDNTMIVLDASGSMWGQIGGKSKIEIARETLARVAADIPSDRAVGLIAYGHRSRGDCADIELIVPTAAGNGPAIAEAANRLQPKGKTPLTGSVRQAAEALRHTEDKATVILITDGIETCDADPCALAAELEASGLDFTTHVVGFGLTTDEGEQVACLAENTGGRYIQAGDAAALNDALAQTVIAAAAEPVTLPEPEPQPAGNLVVTMALCESCDDITDEMNPRWDIHAAAADGVDGRGEKVAGDYGAGFRRAMPPGDYILETQVNGIQRRMPFTVGATGTTELHVDWNAGFAAVTPKASKDAAAPLSGARIALSVGDWNGAGYGPYSGFVPAGEVSVTGTEGAASVTETLTVVAGERIERDLVIGTGTVTLTVLYAEGGPKVEDTGLRYDFFAPGNDRPVTGGYGSDARGTVPAGEVFARVTLGHAGGQSAPVAVPAGGSAEILVVLNAGVLAVSAPGATRIEILGARAKINGERDRFGGTYGQDHQATLPPGEYLVRTRHGDAEPKEAMVNVSAGERTEFSPN